MCGGWYDEFAFHKIYHRVNHFCIVDLSAFYFDVLKDRLYISAPKSQARRSAQTAIWRIGEALVRLLAPIMSFTCEEVWQYLPKVAARAESVHVAQFPRPAEILGDASTRAGRSKPDEEWTSLRSVRDEVLKALEEARNSKLIGTGLEAQVVDHCVRSGVFAAAAPCGATALPVHRVGGHARAGFGQRNRRRPR